MTTLATSADILDDVLFRASEPTDGTSEFDTQALQYLNRAYRAIWMGGGEFVPEINEPWLWLKKSSPGVLTLLPVDTTGTVAATNNNTAITFSVTKATDLDGYFLRVQGHADVFRISAHTAGSASATLDGPYTGTDVTTASFQLMKLEYALAADVLRVIGPMRVQADGHTEIDGVDLTSLERDWPLTSVTGGTPEVFAMVTEQSVRFSHAGGNISTMLKRVEYDYLRIPDDLVDDSTEPLVPLQHRQVLADIALFLLLSAKSDQRAEAVGPQAQAGLRAMAADNRARFGQFSRRVGAITPRMRKTAAHRRILRTTSGLIIG